MTQDEGHVPRSGKTVFLRRLLEEEREAHDLLALATDASLLGWGTWDLETGRTEWDERGRRIMGFEEDAREAQSAEAWMERIHPEDRQRLKRHIEECIARGKNFRFEYRIVLPDGEVRHILGTGMFCAGADGMPRRGTGLVQDITEQKMAQAERDRLRSLEATARAQGAERASIGRELHDRVSHLLGVVHQSLELHEAFERDDPSRAREKMELAKRTTKEAMRWTRDLSEMLRVPESESGMREMLEQLLHHEIPDRITRRLSMEGDDLAVSAVVREQLFLMLREAIRNVVSHSGADEMSVSVSVGAGRIEGVVEDDGRGIDRAETRYPLRRGGLGYMAQRAKAHGGTCSVESVPGKGTRVKASFPVS